MLIPFFHNEKYGFVEKTNYQPKDLRAWGKLIVIPVQFKEVTVFQDGFASVSLDGEMWGLIDETGKIIADFIYIYPLEIFNGIPYIQDEDRDLKRIDGKVENVPITEKSDEPSAHEIEQELFKKVLSEFPSPLFNRVARHLFDDYYWVMNENYYKRSKKGIYWERFSGVIKLSSREIIIPIRYQSFNPFILPNKEPFFIAGLSNMGDSQFINLVNEVIFSVRNHNIYHFDNRYLMVENKGESYLMDYNFNRIPDEIAKEIKGFDVMIQQDVNYPIFMAGDGSVGWTDASRQNVVYQNHDACDIMFCENTDYRRLTSRDWSYCFWVDLLGNEVFRYPSRKAGITFYKEHNYKILQDEFRNKHLLDADFQEIILSKSPIKEIIILNDGAFFMITYSNKKKTIFDENYKKIKLPKHKHFSFRGNFFIFTQQIDENILLSGSCDLNKKIITPCVHYGAEFLRCNTDGNINFKESENIIRCRNLEDYRIYYWTDFEHNVVYKS